MAPGFIDTDMTRARRMRSATSCWSIFRWGGWAPPEDIAHAVAFLASPEAGYITGATLHVNGGMYMT